MIRCDSSRIAARSYAVVALHDPKAAAAASIAATASSGPPSATVAITSPVAGSWVSKVRPEAASDQVPSM